MIMAGAGKAQSFTQVQLNALGIEFEFVSGWKLKLVGREVSLDNYNKFLKLRGMKKDPDGPMMYRAGQIHKMDTSMPMDLGL